MVYLDDLIIFSSSLQKHLKGLAQVFERLRQVNLKIHPEKTHFLQTTVVFLGYQIGEGGIKVDPGKIQAIKEYPAPRTKKEVQRFFGLANFYRQFIKNFAEIALPLNRLVRKNAIFKWDSMCQRSFDELKEQLCAEHILAFPDFEKEFVVYTDASGEALGAVLHNSDGRPVNYASRTLKDAETRYSTVEKELLAIVFATKVFRPYLLGRHFLVKTDHRPLQWLNNMSLASSRLTKFRLQLDEFDFDVEHLPGTKNAAADALSRKPIDLTLTEQQIKTVEEVRTMFTEEVSVMTRAQARAQKGKDPDMVIMSKAPAEEWRLRIDSTAKGIHKNPPEKLIGVGADVDEKELTKELTQLRQKQKVQAVVVTRNEAEGNPQIPRACVAAGVTLLVIPNIMELKEAEHRKIALREAHILPTAGHAGVTRMWKTLRRKFYWPGMFRDVVTHVKKCEACRLMKKLSTPKPPQLLTDTPGEPFVKVYLDIVGPIDPPSRRRHSYILTMKDDFSKFILAKPVRQKTAQEVTATFLKAWVLRFGMPGTIVTDQGNEFKGIMPAVLKELGVGQKTSTPYHHQTVGCLENTHKPLGEFLRIYAKDKEDWDQWLPYFVFAFNTTENVTTGYTPFELLFGRSCRRPSELTDGEVPTAPESYDDYVAKLRYALKRMYRDVQKSTLSHKLQNIRRSMGTAAPQKVESGAQVYVRRGNRKKMDPVSDGPFNVEKVEYPNVTVRTDKGLKTVHVDRLVR